MLFYMANTYFNRFFVLIDILWFIQHLNKLYDEKVHLGENNKLGTTQMAAIIFTYHALACGRVG